MKKLNLLVGITAVLFLVASAMPAYSAKPWPNGNRNNGEKGPAIEEGFDSLDEGTTCTDGTPGAQNLFDAAEGHYDALGYSMNNKDAKDELFEGYPMPITADLALYEDGKTDEKDRAAMAWDTYHSLAGFNDGKDVSDKMKNVVNKFLNNVSYSEEDIIDPVTLEVVGVKITIIDGGRITGDDLQGVYDDLADLRDCVTP